MIFNTTPAKLRELADKLEAEAEAKVHEIAFAESCGGRSYDLFIRAPLYLKKPADQLNPLDFVNIRYVAADDSDFKYASVIGAARSGWALSNLRKLSW